MQRCLLALVYEANDGFILEFGQLLIVNREALTNVVMWEDSPYIDTAPVQYIGMHM
jgi:hypothetical protein